MFCALNYGTSQVKSYFFMVLKYTLIIQEFVGKGEWTLQRTDTKNAKNKYAKDVSILVKELGIISLQNDRDH